MNLYCNEIADAITEVRDMAIACEIIMDEMLDLFIKLKMKYHDTK